MRLSAGCCHSVTPSLNARCEVSDEYPDFLTVAVSVFLPVIGQCRSGEVRLILTSITSSAIPSGPHLTVSPGPQAVTSLARLREPLEISDWSNPVRLSCLVVAARPGPVITWYLNRQAGNLMEKQIETTNNSDGTVDVTRWDGLILTRRKVKLSLSNYIKQY